MSDTLHGIGHRLEELESSLSGGLVLDSSYLSVRQGEGF
jgi:hypothetical protein